MPHFNKTKDSKAKSKQDLRFVGFTFKKAADDAKIKSIVSLFDEIEQARDQKKKLDLQEDKPEEKKLHWMQKIPGGFPGTPKSPNSNFQPTLMVSPRKETSVKLPITIKPTQPKPQPSQPTIQMEIQKKTQEGRAEPGKMLYYGPYSSKGFGRSSSNDNNPIKSKPFAEGMGSPKKQEALSSRKSPGIAESRKTDLLMQNVLVSPSGQTSTKKKGFGFLGLKFLGKK